MITVNDVSRILKKMYSKFDKTTFEETCADMGLPMDKQI